MNGEPAKSWRPRRRSARSSGVVQYSFSDYGPCRSHAESQVPQAGKVTGVDPGNIVVNPRSRASLAEIETSLVALGSYLNRSSNAVSQKPRTRWSQGPSWRVWPLLVSRDPLTCNATFSLFADRSAFLDRSFLYYFDFSERIRHTKNLSLATNRSPPSVHTPVPLFEVSHK